MHPFFRQNQFPVLQTARLRLRQLTPSDAEGLLFHRTDPVLNRYIFRRPEDQISTVEEASELLVKFNQQMEEGKSFMWSMDSLNGKEFIGSICLWNFSEDLRTAELGYGLNPEFHRQGLMSEAVNAVIQFGFKELKFSNIEAYTHRDNKASRILLEKSGFTLVEGKKDHDNDYNVVYNCSKPVS